MKSNNSGGLLRTGLAVLVVVVLLGSIALYFYIQKTNQDLLENGIREEVVVVQKYRTGTRKSPHFYMDVDWFDVVEEAPLYSAKDTTGMSNAEKMSDDILNKVFGKKTRKKIARRNQTIKLKYINGNTYTNVSVGEIVTLVYFKENPRDGRLLREIED